MNYKILCSGVLRTPLISYAQNNEESWSILKKAIEYSSDCFYDVIRNLNYDDFKNLDFKIQYTIWKYFNRARFRATPYGLFGSCSSFLISSEEHTDNIVVEKNFAIHSFIDWPFKNHISLSEELFFMPDRIYKSNESIYYVSDSIRYIYRQEKMFEIASVDRSLLVDSLLNFCKIPISYQEIIKYLEDTAALNATDVQDLLNEFLRNQLLYTDLSPNIIGPDYFERINVTVGKPVKEYILTDRKVIEGSLSAEIFKSFNDCINCLESLAEEVKSPELNTFKRDFLSRFEDQEISLLKALDPEIGIGYGNLTQIDGDDKLHELFSKDNLDNTCTIQWGRLENFLLEQVIVAGNDPKYIIQLENYAHKKDNEQNTLLPNTFSALVNVIDDLIILENLGGCTATSLLGRFTRSNLQINEICRELMQIEAETNPDVIFFDIAYLSEDQVDNVNRRAAIYDYELPVLVYSCSTNPVDLHDICLWIHNNEVILYSSHYKKRLIPRLSSAYNYFRSDLSLYRFLCDLQHQGIKSQLGFDFQNKIPGLNFYPRLQYENIVISPAKWKIDIKECQRFNSQAIIEKYNLSALIKIRNNDQSLTFDTASLDDLAAFSHFIKQQKNDFYIEESFIPQKPLVIDEQQNPYLPQFVLSFHHSQLIYKGASSKKKASSDLPARVDILQGNDWLYFEIYCHPLSANSILTDNIGPFIDKNQQNIEKWFFIRYFNPKHHLRLRIQIKPGINGYSIIRELTEVLSRGFDDGKIEDIQLKPYKKEIERYGSDLIEEIEIHFFRDSLFVLNLLAMECLTQQIYRLLLDIALDVLESIKSEITENLSLTQFYLENFIIEHNWGIKEFKNLNKRYASFKQHKEFEITEPIAEMRKVLIESFNNLLLLRIEGRQSRLFGDLFHMLVNRLFAEHQRIHEGVIYYYLVKEFQKQSKFKSNSKI